MAAVPAPPNKGPTTTKDPAGVRTSAGTGAGGGPATAETGTGTETLTPARWRDPKRYAWLLGLIVPTLPFLAYGLVWATGLGIFWFYGPVLVFAIFPVLDLLSGVDPTNPPDSVIKWLEQDRYYRWCTYAFLPIQYAGLVSRAGCGPAANSRRLMTSG